MIPLSLRIFSDISTIITAALKPINSILGTNSAKCQFLNQFFTYLSVIPKGLEPIHFRAIPKWRSHVAFVTNKILGVIPRTKPTMNYRESQCRPCQSNPSEWWCPIMTLKQRGLIRFRVNWGLRANKGVSSKQIGSKYTRLGYWVI